MSYALITGASGGIGGGIAKALSLDGYDLVLHYNRNQAAAEKLRDDLVGSGGKASIVQFDMSSEESVGGALKDLIGERGAPYILINNAGIARDKLFIAMKTSDWDSVLDTNLRGFYLVTRPLLRVMLKERRGRIVSIASTSGQRGNPGQVNYAASKAGLVGATKALALEVANRGITVNAVAPGLIETEMVTDDAKENLLKMIPLGRLGKPQEVGAAVSYLCSEGAGYVTGQVISVNGGLYT
ncbi:MAG: 3-oxoacyl-ACP reductase FabG [Myxococcota bacterium]|nr:3-oxoacyl-ACP reductase FabG [Myxococcota bacterium]